MRNEFDSQTRLIFFDLWECWLCGQNGEGRGGLELHHIKGRESNSALNAAPLCHYCHEHMNHNDKEEKDLMARTVRFLVRICYNFNEDDLAFYAKYKKIYDSIT
jgi:hypothetical protein